MLLGMGKLLVITRRVFSPGIRVRMQGLVERAVATLPEELRSTEVVTSSDPLMLCSLRPDEYAGVVVNIHTRRRDPELPDAIDRYLLSGGGALLFGPSLGACLALPPASITGARPRHVSPATEFSRVFDEVPPFRIGEAPYLHAFEAGGVDVHFTAAGDEPGREAVPVVWTRYRGKGRLCCIGFGRTSRVFRTPEVAATVERALHWILGHID